jgi:hypothetical protein
MIPSLPTTPSVPSMPSSPVPVKKQYQKPVFYTIAIVALLVASSFISLISGVDVSWLYLGVQLAFVLTGIIHALLLYKFYPNLSPEQTGKSLLVTLLITVLGAGAIVATFHFWKGSASMGINLAGSTLLFMLPFCIMAALYLFMAIPPRIYKLWKYPVEHEMPDLDMLDLSKIIVVEFVFSKYKGDPKYSSFKAKAPLQMPFGELFFLFINDYNEKHADGTIQVLDENQTPHNWIFYKKPKWWQRRHFCDPEKNFQQNNIKDNNVVIAVRL